MNEFKQNHLCVPQRSSALISNQFKRRGTLRYAEVIICETAY